MSIRLALASDGRATLGPLRVDKEGSSADETDPARDVPRREVLLLAGVLGLHMLYALLSAGHYGQSWDDAAAGDYGQRVLGAYAGSPGHAGPGDEKYYGPAFFMIAAGASELLLRMAPSWQPADIWHVLTFASYLGGLAAFYILARRLLPRGPAAATTLLLAYQPVLFGHASINQKDIPFFSAFLAAVVLGLQLGDARPPQGAGFLDRFRQGYRRLSPGRRVLLGSTLIAGGPVAFDLLFGSAIRGASEGVVAAAFRGEAWGPLNALFTAMAQDASKTPLDAYLEKWRVVLSWLRVPAAYLAIAPGFLSCATIARPAGKSRSRTLAGAGRVALAAAALGVTMSIRVGGVFAGLLVSLSVLAARRWRGVPALLAYWALALSLCYMTWPYLWDAPVARFLESARLMARFPAHMVIFRGASLSSHDLPWDYLPTLLGIQLTEPALLLVVLGLFALPTILRAPPDRRLAWVVLGIWILVPLAASALLRTPLYSNFRQVLFALPPLFLAAGLGLDRLWRLAARPAIRLTLVLAAVAPGVAAIAALRPYEYIYYNVLAGGTRGAEGRFPHDYWCTSSREAVGYVNAAAPFGSVVALYEPMEVATPFLRADLQAVGAREKRAREAVFVLRCNNLGDFTSRNLDEFPGAFAVTRAGVVLSVVLPGPASK